MTCHELGKMDTVWELWIVCFKPLRDKISFISVTLYICVFYFIFSKKRKNLGARAHALHVIVS